METQGTSPQPADGRKEAGTPKPDLLAPLPPASPSGDGKKDTGADGCLTWIKGTALLFFGCVLLPENMFRYQTPFYRIHLLVLLSTFAWSTLTLASTFRKGTRIRARALAIVSTVFFWGGLAMNPVKIGIELELLHLYDRHDRGQRLSTTEGDRILSLGIWADRVLLVESVCYCLSAGFFAASRLGRRVRREQLAMSDTPDGLAFPPDHPTEKELRAFVGPRANYYLDEWRCARPGESRGWSFNWAAHLAPGLWLPYRKMYLLTFLFYTGVCPVLAVVEVLVSMDVARLAKQRELGLLYAATALGLVVPLGVWFVCGMAGNRLYLSHTRKKIRRIRSRWESTDAGQDYLSNDLYLKALSQRGGTNPLALTVILILHVVLFIAYVLSLIEILHGIRSRAEGDMRTERTGGPSGSRRLGIAVEWPEDKAVEARSQGGHPRRSAI
jgi:hypothetical protein